MFEEGLKLEELLDALFKEETEEISILKKLKLPIIAGGRCCAYSYGNY